MKTFDEILHESWASKNWERVKAQPTILGKIGKFVGNYLFGGDAWDDISDTMSEYMNEPGLSQADKMKRINEISSVFRKFDGRGEVFSKEQIDAAQ
jgi:hypothetical protein